jgi:hypothetical protein
MSVKPLYPNPTQPKENLRSGTQDGAPDHGAHSDPGASDDLARFFGCSICDSSGLGWAGLCEDREHLRQELDGFEIRKGRVFVTRYLPLDVRRQLGAVRFLVAHKPAQARKPQERLAVALKEHYDLPDELQPVWDALMQERAQARAERLEAQRQAEREALWAPLYEKLDAHVVGLPPDEQATPDHDVRHWAANGGVELAKAHGFDPAAPALEGRNRTLAIRFLQKQRPDVAKEIGVA